ncbi:hypothetical protein HY384_01815 [Candidatus Daviesbacteria bacterium]|nr:hypothetical protein [Candidatus Daviesbacteria bacterium]
MLVEILNFEPTLSLKELDPPPLTIARPIERILPPTEPQGVQITSGVGENSQLEGTGFILSKEIKRLFKNYNQNIRIGKTPEEAWAISVDESILNIRTFVLEYIQSSTVLPHKNKLEEVNGVNRMVGDNGVLVVDGITGEERQGGVKEASLVVDNFISAKAPNRVAIINSPLGHSGLFKKDGSGITYKNNQAMVFWINEQGELNGLTLVTDLKEEQARALSVRLGVDEGLLTGQTELERVSSIVRNPALFSYAQGLKNPAEYVLDKIVAIRGSSDFRLAQEDGSIEIRSVEQTRKDIQRMTQLLTFNQVIENYLAQLRNNLLGKLNNLNDSIIQSEIARQIEETILGIVVDHLQKTPNKYYSLPSQYRSTPYSTFQEDKFMLAAAFLKTRAGCAGGGSSSSLRRISLGSGIFSTESLSTENRGGNCNKCGIPNLDNHYHCPECPAKYADETNKSPEARTKQCSCGFEFGC